ncbi:hypothetical protein J1614_011440 [Plenodomus biglobosus]|nr:hypothetical protein J1614_011440 [Plenodomus biglobosus]
MPGLNQRKLEDVNATQKSTVKVLIRCATPDDHPSTPLRHYAIPIPRRYGYTAALIHELQRRTKATFPAASPIPFSSFDHKS